jgi:hypothetical protein
MGSQFLSGSHKLVCEFEGTFENSLLLNSVAIDDIYRHAYENKEMTNTLDEHIIQSNSVQCFILMC